MAFIYFYKQIFSLTHISKLILPHRPDFNRGCRFQDGLFDYTIIYSTLYASLTISISWVWNAKLSISTVKKESAIVRVHIKTFWVLKFRNMVPL